MSKEKYPITQAVRFLRAKKINFDFALYDYEEHGGTRQGAEFLGIAENFVIKTIVLIDENKKGLIVLMHGDKEISLRNLARQIGRKHIEQASAETATKWTGYIFGGTSPFGIKANLPIFVEKTIMDLPYFWINGGKRGFQVKLTPQDLKNLLSFELVEVGI